VFVGIDWDDKLVHQQKNEKRQLMEVVFVTKKE